MSRRTFESVEIGEGLSLVRGPLTEPIMMRWSAAMENWHRIHYDRRFALEHEQLPELLVNGSLKQQFIMTMLRKWAGTEGWVWKVKFQFRAMNLAGETLQVWARAVEKRREAQFGIIDLELGIKNGDGKESTPGTAMVALPYEGGLRVPYPFVAPNLE
jgi:hydroxyacyl-ACP dehydratase HTD2-like protein with hotdog domain